MVGRNVIMMNQATIVEAVQEYLSKRTVDTQLVTVELVSQTFHNEQMVFEVVVNGKEVVR